VTANLLNSIPVIQITDARRSVEYYCDKLGFTKNWEHRFEPSFPCFVSISRGPVTLFLTEHPESAAGALTYLNVDDVDAFAHELQAQGVVVEQGAGNPAMGHA
jgi:catechol 2,3-dioxygenase-like lactoylglutathione lyase family enzyme